MFQTHLIMIKLRKHIQKIIFTRFYDAAQNFPLKTSWGFRKGGQDAKDLNIKGTVGES